jgi:hypothetical protein
MASLLDFPDNLILHLERDLRSYKAFTTEERGKFKLLYGLDSKDSIIDTKFINERELKQVLVDASVNGYELKINLAFKKNLYGIAKELAAEREAQVKAEETSDVSNRSEVLYDC